ncbi:MAG: hypothetical protein IPO32_18590 [Crocinitomicaceae bacterium]|nr:hypothetical protein [Crocinitomicaceae bacterium]
MNTITSIIVYFLLSAGISIWIAIFLTKRARKDRSSYPQEWWSFKHAIENNDIKGIAKYGSNVLWNNNLTKEHKQIIYTEVEKRKDLPALQKLWKDVYYQTNGFEPK